LPPKTSTGKNPIGVISDSYSLAHNLQSLGITELEIQMHDLEKQKDAEEIAHRNILRGPPGLLFGLTLLVFAGARLCFGWDADPTQTPQKDAVQQSVAQQDDSSAPLLTRADFINQ
jgi:hypothetical protein